MISRPDPSEYSEYFGRYIAYVPEEDIRPILYDQNEEVMSNLGGLSESEALTRHAPYTWSIKEVVGHLSDAERVFAYRALRFARADRTPLPGFEENDYVREAHFDNVSFRDLLEEWSTVRQATLTLYRPWKGDVLLRGGQASGVYLSVRALAYIVAGHTRHHLAIVRRRLGKT